VGKLKSSKLNERENIRVGKQKSRKIKRKKIKGLENKRAGKKKILV
jgi:hypothetical protein